MSDPFSLELTEAGDSVELRYPVSAVLYIVLTALVALGLVYPVVGASPGLRIVWQMLLDLTVLGVAFAAVWFVWLSTVCFDFARNQVRRGLVTIGRASDIESIEPSADDRAALQIVFRDQPHAARRWRIPGVRAQQAPVLGPLLAKALRVPFRPLA